MELRPLVLFVLACRHDSHAAAARPAGVSPSTLSAAISQLEADLGLTLFRRGPAGVAPGNVGRWLCFEAETLLQWADAFAAADLPPAPLYVHSPLRLTFSASSRGDHGGGTFLAHLSRLDGRPVFCLGLWPADVGGCGCVHRLYA